MSSVQPALFETRTAPRPSRRVQGGISTSDVVMAAHIGDNADIFPEILQLHVPVGAKIADVTYGGGIFWKKVNVDLYHLTPSDIASGVDCRSLPYESEAFDCVVLDPPYMEGLFRRDGSHLAG